MDSLNAFSNRAQECSSGSVRLWLGVDRVLPVSTAAWASRLLFQGLLNACNVKGMVTFSPDNGTIISRVSGVGDTVVKGAVTNGTDVADAPCPVRDAVPAADLDTEIVIRRA